jgi:hypothetical protein
MKNCRENFRSQYSVVIGRKTLSNFNAKRGFLVRSPPGLGTRLEIRALKRYVRQNSILSNICKCHGKGISKQIPNAPGQAGGRHDQR